VIIGHYAVAFAACKSDRDLPLWHVMIAVVWLNILHSSMVILGVEGAIIVPGITAVVPIDLAYTASRPESTASTATSCPKRKEGYWNTLARISTAEREGGGEGMTRFPRTTRV